MRPARSGEKCIEIGDLRSKLRYCPDSGKCFWVTASMCGRGRVRVSAGDEAGTSMVRDGRVIICALGTRLMRYRVAWALTYGHWPDGCVDHVDGDPSNDRIENLRIASVSQNIANSTLRSDNKSGLKGVTLCRETGRWKAQIGTHGRTKHIGRFDTVAEAHAAYMAEAQRVFGNFACSGIRGAS